MRKASLPAGGGHGPSLVLLLLCSLVLSAILAYHAQDAARSHRAASESALRDYAGLAADELARHLDDAVDDLARGTLDARGDAERRRGAEVRLDEFVEEMRDEVGPCGCPELLHDYFILDLRDGTVQFREGSLAPEGAGWIARAVQAHATAADAGRLLDGTPATSVRVRNRGGRGREFPDGLSRVDLPHRSETSVLYAPSRDDAGELERAYGLVIERDAYAAATLRAIVAEVPLLPPSLTQGAGDDMLSVTVASEGDTLFHAGGPAEATTEAVDTLPTALGTYLLHVAVRPAMADRLVIGGLPRSRFPLLLAIFLLTLGLSAIAIVQLRRQQALVGLRSGFIASVSHELRTPLAQIRLFSDLLASGRLDETQRARSVRIIGEEAQRLAYLVENVLRFSRSAPGQDRVILQPGDLSALAREIVDGFVPLAAARGVRIETSLQPGAVAPMDADAVRQVLLNLLDNAVKYGPAGQTVRVGVEKEGSALHLWVDDEGRGIPAADRAAIWEPYHRLQRDAEAATGGSGIGLAVVRDLVEMHGGTVAVEAAPKGGARFVVRLPAEPPPPARRPAEEPAGRGVPA